MNSAVRAGSLYFSVVFAAGFALGVLRTLFIAPAVGEVQAVLLEVPVMLMMAWVACGWTLNKVAVPRSVPARLLMGAAALLLLLAAEAALSVVASGKTLTEHFASYSRPGALIGLVAQLAFGCFPLIRSSGAQPRSA